jgi:4-hydroxybenzoate polyprenyltransferase
MLAAAGYLNMQGPAYFLLSIGGTGIHLVWQYRTVDLANPRSCWGVSIDSLCLLSLDLSLVFIENFNRNGQLGWIIWGGLMVDYSLRIMSSGQI